MLTFSSAGRFIYPPLEHSQQPGAFLLFRGVLLLCLLHPVLVLVRFLSCFIAVEAGLQCPSVHDTVQDSKPERRVPDDLEI